jgi:hypothetical protein
MAGQEQKQNQKAQPAQKAALTAEEQKLALEQQKRVEARKAQRTAAKVRVLEFMKGVKDAQLLADLKFFVSQTRERGEATVKAISAPLKDALVKAGAKGMTGLDIYRQFKLGEPEMRIKQRTLIQRAKPEDRCWVGYDAEKNAADGGTYTVLAIGAEAPKGWDGYVPSDEEEL